jgi:dihydrofolate reductase
VSVVVDITMSLDGYVTAPGADADHGLGIDGMELHRWALEGDDVDRSLLRRAMDRTGAVVMGRHTFDVVDGPNGWNDDIGYGARTRPSDVPPCFVVTSTTPDHVRLADRFTVVTDGLTAAIELAASAAGDQDVVVMGGGALCGSTLAAGLADELVLHVSPLVLGGGTPLWSGAVRTPLELVGSTVTPNATHLTYRVLREA